MLTSFLEYALYSLFFLSLGSFSAAFSVRWPTKALLSWQQEAHQILSIPFQNTSLTDDTKRSQCPNCKHTLAWFDLIPLLSYFLLKRRCRYCMQTISYRYPTIEALHLICCLPLLWIHPDTKLLILHALLLSSFITLAVIDAEHQLIPDECCVVILVCALSINLINQTLESSVLGLLIGYSSIYALHWGYKAVRGKDGIGLGDVKLIAAIGAWLGIFELASMLLCASLSGILYNATLNKKGSGSVPFGPFLIFSAILVFYL
ncbi:MAG: A24 family peptidase [Marinomonas sp.]